MPITLTGLLICADDAQAALVRRYLPEHFRLSRAEPECLWFDVDVTDNPLVWSVNEGFQTRAAFDAHQTRVKNSEWGRKTAHISREYTLSEG